MLVLPVTISVRGMCDRDHNPRFEARFSKMSRRILMSFALRHARILALATRGFWFFAGRSAACYDEACPPTLFPSMPNAPTLAELIDRGDALAIAARLFNSSLLQKDSTEDLQEALEWAAIGGHPECIKILIPLCNPKAHDSFALRAAALNGHPACLALLIPASDPQANDSSALCSAAENGHAECVKLLLECAPPKSKRSRALALAAHHGRLECLRILAPVSDAKDRHSLALFEAANMGHRECVELLIPLSDLSAKKFHCLRWAAIRGHADCLGILLEACPKSTSEFRAAAGEAFIQACIHGYADCVEMLIGHADPLLDDSEALRLAAEEGHAECVKLLIPVSDPLIAREAASIALVNEHPEAALLISQFMADHEARLISDVSPMPDAATGRQSAPRL